MKKAKWMGTLAAGLLIGTSAPAEHRCSKWTRGGGLIEGYNCAYPSDASGPPLFISERVIGKVRWAASLPDLYGLYEFDAAFLYFVVRGKSRIQPVVGDEVEIVIQSVLYGGMLESFR